MKKYSGFNLIRNAFSGHRNWPRAWRDPEPKKHYDVAYDVSPIVGKTAVENLYISTGWGTGGYKAIPAGGDTLAYTIANDESHELLKPFQLDRFASGRGHGVRAGSTHCPGQLQR